MVIKHVGNFLSGVANLFMFCLSSLKNHFTCCVVFVAKCLELAVYIHTMYEHYRKIMPSVVSVILCKLDAEKI